MSVMTLTAASAYPVPFPIVVRIAHSQTFDE